MAAAALVLVPLLLSAVASPASAAGGENETRIKVYWHDVVSGPNLTAVMVAQAAVTNPSRFGDVVVTDNALTEGPEPSSRLVGRSQGTYIGADKAVRAFLMNMNFVFQAGDYNGSTVAIFGRNEVLSSVREMIILGGTGVFRSARGYVESRTLTVDFQTGGAIVEYNLFIKH